MSAPDMLGWLCVGIIAGFVFYRIGNLINRGSRNKWTGRHDS